jgi:hypothetical protein
MEPRMGNAVDTIYNRDQSRRVVIFRRDDGSFGYEDQFYCDETGYDCWLPWSQPGSRFATQDIAWREALSQGEWAGMELESLGEGLNDA